MITQSNPPLPSNLLEMKDVHCMTWGQKRAYVRTFLGRREGREEGRRDWE